MKKYTRTPRPRGSKMKEVTINAEQYEQVVYMAVATTPSDDMKQLRLASKVLDKLEAAGVRKPGDKILCPNCRVDITQLTGSKGGFKLMAEQETFEFEDAEAEFVVKRIETTIPKLQTWAARSVLSVVDQLEADNA